jgi:hypothetical protein
MAISLNPALAVLAVQGVAADRALQPGTVIQARVVRVLDGDQVRIAVGNQTIDVTSEVPLQPGQLLQLAVSQQAGGVRLAILSQQPGASASAASADQAYSAVIDTVTLAPDAAVTLAPQIATVIAKNQLSAPETVAVAVAAETAATRQTSLAPLFENLAVAANLGALPPKLQQVAAQLLALRPSVDANFGAADLKAAFQNSGLFLEASLASGAAPASATPDLKAALLVLRQVLATTLGTATPQSSAIAALASSVAQQSQQGAGSLSSPAVAAVSSSPTAVVAPTVPDATVPTAAVAPAIADALPRLGINPASVPLTEPAAAVVDEFLAASAISQIIPPANTPAAAGARAAAISAALAMLQETPVTSPSIIAAARPLTENGTMLSLLPIVAGLRKGSLIDDDSFARTTTPPPPIRGALPAVQAVLPATLGPDVPIKTALHQLIADTDGAIARQTLLQVASLPERVDAGTIRQESQGPRWNFEIPFVTPQGTAVAQFEIARDGGDSDTEPAKRVWRARFTLDVEPAGPVHALISLSGERTSVRFWAERPATAVQLRDGAAQLGQALRQADLQPGDIVIRHGAPPQSAPAPAGHFLDRAL